MSFGHAYFRQVRGIELEKSFELWKSCLKSLISLLLKTIIIVFEAYDNYFGRKIGIRFEQTTEKQTSWNLICLECWKFWKFLMIHNFRMMVSSRDRNIVTHTDAVMICSPWDRFFAKNSPNIPCFTYLAWISSVKLDDLIPKMNISVILRKNIL